MNDLTIPSGILRAAGLTDVGNVRGRNEDAFVVLPGRGLVIVSDGLGGHAAGDIASRHVVEALPQMIDHALAGICLSDSEAYTERIRDTLIEVSRDVRDRGRVRPEWEGMGATVVLALFRNHKAYIAHMGDSRAYLHRGSEVELLTEDHSVVRILLREGEITEEDAIDHPARGMLSNYVGMNFEVYPDLKTVELMPGDRLLLCTDGLTDELAYPEIRRIMIENKQIEQACQVLIGRAKEGGARDNITAVVAEWLGNPSDSGI